MSENLLSDADLRDKGVNKTGAEVYARFREILVPGVKVHGSLPPYFFSPGEIQRDKCIVDLWKQFENYPLIFAVAFAVQLTQYPDAIVTLFEAIKLDKAEEHGYHISVTGEIQWSSLSAEAFVLPTIGRRSVGPNTQTYTAQHGAALSLRGAGMQLPMDFITSDSGIKVFNLQMKILVISCRNTWSLEIVIRAKEAAIENQVRMFSGISSLSRRQLEEKTIQLYNKYMVTHKYTNGTGLNMIEQVGITDIEGQTGYRPDFFILPPNVIAAIFQRTDYNLPDEGAVFNRLGYAKNGSGSATYSQAMYAEQRTLSGLRIIPGRSYTHSKGHIIDPLLNELVFGDFVPLARKPNDMVSTVYTSNSRSVKVVDFTRGFSVISLQDVVESSGCFGPSALGLLTYYGVQIFLSILTKELARKQGERSLGVSSLSSILSSSPNNNGSSSSCLVPFGSESLYSKNSGALEDLKNSAYLKQVLYDRPGGTYNNNDKNDPSQAFEDIQDRLNSGQFRINQDNASDELPPDHIPPALNLFYLYQVSDLLPHIIHQIQKLTDSQFELLIKLPRFSTLDRKNDDYEQSGGGGGGGGRFRGSGVLGYGDDDDDMGGGGGGGGGGMKKNKRKRTGDHKSQYPKRSKGGKKKGQMEEKYVFQNNTKYLFFGTKIAEEKKEIKDTKKYGLVGKIRCFTTAHCPIFNYFLPFPSLQWPLEVKGGDKNTVCYPAENLIPTTHVSKAVFIIDMLNELSQDYIRAQIGPEDLKPQDFKENIKSLFQAMFIKATMKKGGGTTKLQAFYQCFMSGDDNIDFDDKPTTILENTLVDWALVNMFFLFFLSFVHDEGKRKQKRNPRTLKGKDKRERADLFRGWERIFWYRLHQRSDTSDVDPSDDVRLFNLERTFMKACKKMYESYIPNDSSLLDYKFLEPNDDDPDTSSNVKQMIQSVVDNNGLPIQKGLIGEVGDAKGDVEFITLVKRFLGATEDPEYKPAGEGGRQAKKNFIENMIALAAEESARLDNGTYRKNIKEQKDSRFRIRMTRAMISKLMEQKTPNGIHMGDGSDASWFEMKQKLAESQWVYVVELIEVYGKIIVTADVYENIYNDVYNDSNEFKKSSYSSSSSCSSASCRTTEEIEVLLMDIIISGQAFKTFFFLDLRIAVTAILFRPQNVVRASCGIMGVQGPATGHIIIKSLDMVPKSEPDDFSVSFQVRLETATVIREIKNLKWYPFLSAVELVRGGDWYIVNMLTDITNLRDRVDIRKSAIPVLTSVHDRFSQFVDLLGRPPLSLCGQATETDYTTSLVVANYVGMDSTADRPTPFSVYMGDASGDDTWVTFCARQSYQTLRADGEGVDTTYQGCSPLGPEMKPLQYADLTTEGGAFQGRTQHN